MPTTHYVNAKISEEAKVCAEMIKIRVKPDHEIQQIISACVLDWVRREAPELLEDVQAALRTRQEARRDAKARPQPSDGPASLEQ